MIIKDKELMILIEIRDSNTNSLIARSNVVHSFESAQEEIGRLEQFVQVNNNCPNCGYCDKECDNCEWCGTAVNEESEV